MGLDFAYVRTTLGKERVLFWVAAVLIFALIFAGGVGRMWNHRIAHAYPETFLGNDHFLLLAMAEAAYDQGHYRWLPPYLNLGIGKTLTHLPPGSALLPAMLARVAGIPVYDALELFFIALFPLLSIPFQYIFRGAPRAVLVLSLGLLPLLLMPNFVYGIGRSQYPFLLGACFLFLFLAVLFTGVLRNPLVLGMLFAAMFLSHAPQAVFGSLFLFAHWCAHAYRRCAWGWQTLKPYLLTLLVAALGSGIYLYVFTTGSLLAVGGDLSGYTFRSMTPLQFYPQFSVSVWQIPLPVLALICLGFVALSLRPFPNRSVLFAFLLITNLNYLAFLPTLELRAFQYRYLWPILLGPLFGLGSYAVLERLCKREVLRLCLSAAIAVLLAALCTLYVVSVPKPQQVITAEQYEAFRWIEERLPDDAEVLFLYGDGYQQSTIALKHPHARMRMEDMVHMLLTNFSSDRITAAYDRDGIDVRKAFNGTLATPIDAEISHRLSARTNRSICDFPYYVLDRNSRITEGSRLVVFNARFMERAAERDAVTVLFTNDRTVILENTERGERCV